MCPGNGPPLLNNRVKCLLLLPVSIHYKNLNVVLVTMTNFTSSLKTKKGKSKNSKKQ